MAFLTIKDFPDELHRKAKSEAALEGISLKAFIIKALEEYLKKKKRRLSLRADKTGCLNVFPTTGRQ